VTVKLTGPLEVPTEQLVVPAALMLAGHVIAGGCVSLTVTVNTQLSGPALLFDLQVTVVAPTGKKEPEAGEQITVPQVPVVAGALYVTAAPHWFGSFDLVILDGQAIVHLV